jgi:hypothetical protein
MNNDLNRLLELAGLPIDWNIIVEAKEDVLANKFEQEIMAVYNNDKSNKPSFNNATDLVKYLSSTVGRKYIDWLVDQYRGHHFHMGDIHELTTDIAEFEKLKQRGVIDKPDLSHYSVLDLKHAVTHDPMKTKYVTNELWSNAKLKAEQDAGNIHIIFDTPNFKVMIPKNEATSIEYGSGTTWCVSAKESANKFDEYNHSGHLYFINAGNQKFCIHLQMNEFQDEKNVNIINKPGDIEYLSKFPQYTTFLNMLIKKYYQHG